MRSSCARRRRLELCPSWTPRPRNQTSNPEGRGPAIFEIGSGVCAEILPLDTQNLLRKSSTASLSGRYISIPASFSRSFFIWIRDLAHGRRASPLAAGEGQDRERRASWPGSIPLPSLPRPPHTTTPYLRSCPTCPTTPVACRSPPWFPGSPLALNYGSMRRCSQAWLHRWRLHRSLARALPCPPPLHPPSRLLCVDISFHDAEDGNVQNSQDVRYLEATASPADAVACRR